MISGVVVFLPKHQEGLDFIGVIRVGVGRSDILQGIVHVHPLNLRQKVGRPRLKFFSQVGHGQNSVNI